MLDLASVPASGAVLSGTLLSLAVPLCLPVWAQGGRLLQMHRAHLTQRCGLLMLIVLCMATVRTYLKPWASRQATGG